MQKKSKRNREIKKLRNEGHTFQSIGNKYGISRERVRQIFNNIQTRYKFNPVTISRNL
ncbi:MAG: hypothetical protein EOM88_04570 [Clostridia bacterium]|nr:hypothetical protein [Clostridia bacterium]